MAYKKILKRRGLNLEHWRIDEVNISRKAGIITAFGGYPNKACRTESIDNVNFTENIKLQNLSPETIQALKDLKACLYIDYKNGLFENAEEE